ncbi:MAG: PspC domain-containing protein [Acidimicrobiales bacterium]
MDAPTDARAAAAPDDLRPSGPRRLRRLPDDGHVAGVCAGVAEYFNVDPVIVRIATVVLFFSGPGLFAYVLAWIFVPKDKGAARYGVPQARIDRHDRSTQIVGIVLVVVALSVIWGDWWSPFRGWLFPVALMALGGWLLLRGDDDIERPDADAPGPVPADPPATSVSRLTNDDDTSILANPSPPPAPPDRPVGRRRMLGPIVFGGLLVWAGLAVLLGLSVETGLAGDLLIVGAGFVLGSFMGGSRALIIAALVIGGALAVTVAVDIPFSGPIGHQEWTPQSAAAIEDLYDVSMGEGVLDLSAVRPPADGELAVDASVGIGHLVVVVPADTTLEVTTKVGAGESDVLGFRQDGVGVTTDRQVAGTAGAGTITLDLQVGLGEIEVVRAGSDGARPLG